MFDAELQSARMPTRPKDRKDSIVAAAAELFAGRGYAAVGIDDIGAAVGVTGPAVYRHFPGKDAVLAAVFTAAASSLDSAVAAVGNPGGRTEVEQLARAFVTFALDRPALLSTYFRERQRCAGDHSVLLMEERVVRSWRRALRGVNPDLAAANLLVRQGAVVGALSGATARPTPVPRPRLDDLLTESLVAAVLAPPPLARDASTNKWSLPSGKRDEILAAALHLLAVRGFHGVGVDEIGEAAGISGPTVYHYYGSKVELLVDAFDRVGERVAVGAEEAIRLSDSPLDALSRLAASYTAIAAESIDLIVVTSREGFAVPDAERPRLSRRRQRLRDHWARVIGQLRHDAPDTEIRLLVRAVFPLINSAVQAVQGDGHLGDVSSVAMAYCLGC
jgi:AcrR family transcriptional regulator